jgi:predicted metal-dependent hydrolase
VRYEEHSSSFVRLLQRGNEITLKGNAASQLSCRRALKRWLLEQGKQKLIPLLQSISTETNIPFASVSVRLQRSRWGSCSRRGKISLNAKLLFLAPELVRYLFVHELCHRQQMNHSPAFWKCVEDQEADYAALDRRMRTAMQSVPAWAR